MESAQIELVTVLHPRLRKKFDDLKFADLVSECLPWTSGEGNRFRARGLRVHRHLFLQVFCGLVERELSERESYIHFHAERTQTHEVVNNLARMRAIVEKTGLQHHLLCVKANTFICA